jgi:TRAP-type C4-dicarboxylate transport system permease small subunit
MQNADRGNQPLAKVMTAWGTTTQFLWWTIELLTRFVAAATLFAVCLQVVSRFGGLGIWWTEEVTRFLFVWLVFLGMAAGFRRARHARIVMVAKSLPRPVRMTIRHVYVILGSAFFLMVMLQGVQLVSRNFAAGATSPALGINLGWVSLSVVVASALAILAHIESAYLDPDTAKKLQFDRVEIAPDASTSDIPEEEQES